MSAVSHCSRETRRGRRYARPPYCCDYRAADQPPATTTTTTTTIPPSLKVHLMSLLPSSTGYLFISLDRLTISFEKSAGERDFGGIWRMRLDGKCLRSGKEGRKERRWNVNADLESCFCKYERRKGLESRVMQLGRVCT